MRIVPVLCRVDNYMYMLRTECGAHTVVVDPFDVTKLDTAGLTKPSAVLTTHHHHDHAGGNAAFRKTYPATKIYGGSENITAVTDILKNDDVLSFGSVTITALSTPCHTRDHLCYYAVDASTGQTAVFTGDTLFVGGCGRFFEGNAGEMLAAFDKLAKLPVDTTVYVGHEYTAANAQFAKSIEKTNADVDELIRRSADGQSTAGKSTIGDELKWNVFMRTDNTAVQDVCGAKDRVGCMAALRNLKDTFVATA